MAELDPFVAEGFTYLALSFSLVMLRLYIRVRQVGFSKLYLDDYFMLLALVPYFIETGLAYMVGATLHGLTNSNMTDEQRRLLSLSPESDEYRWRVAGSKVQVAGWTVYMSVLWCIKASLCTFYSRLTDGVSGFKGRIRTGYVLLAATYLAVLGSLLFSCHPLHKMWQIYPAPGNICEPALSKVYIYVVMLLNVVTDVYLIIIPVSMLWKTQIPTYKKYGLIAIFSGAVFCMTAGLLRGILILREPVSGIREGSAWACRESFVAFFTSNIPPIWGWLKVKLQPILGSLLSSNSRRTGEPTGDSFRLADHNSSAGGRWGWKSNNNSRFQTHTTTTVIRGGDFDDEDDKSDSSVKELAPADAGIHKDVTVSVRSEAAPGPQGLSFQ